MISEDDYSCISCLYWNFAYHPDKHMTLNSDSSENKKLAVKYALEKNWIKFDLKKTKEWGCNAYKLTKKGEKMVKEYKLH